MRISEKVQSQEPKSQRFLEMGIWWEMWGGCEVRGNWKEKSRRRDTRALSLSWFLSLFQEGVRAGLKKRSGSKWARGSIPRLQWNRTLRNVSARITGSILCLGIAKLSTRYVNGATYIQKTLKTQKTQACKLLKAQAMSCTSFNKVQIHSHAPFILE